MAESDCATMLENKHYQKENGSEKRITRPTSKILNKNNKINKSWLRGNHLTQEHEANDVWFGT
jgi:hypothetical protein